MSSPSWMAASDMVESISLALVHFVWQGALIAVVLALALRATRQRSPDVRYLLSCLALAAMAAAPIVTCLAIDRHVSVLGPAAIEAASARREPWFDPRPWLVIAWGLGVAVLSVRLCGGLVLSRGWHRAAHELDASMQLVCQRLAQRLGIGKCIRLVAAPRVTVPTAIGWLKPVIVFPASAITGLTIAEVEAILAHELAHIRRHDYLVNVMQVAVETLLFYHPAVWWVSQRIRQDREYCCDDVAVALCGDVMLYAHALTALEERRAMTFPLAVSSAGGSLMNRIRRLVGMPPVPSRPSARTALLISSLLGLIVCLSVRDLVASATPPADGSLGGAGWVVSNDGGDATPSTANTEPSAQPDDWVVSADQVSFTPASTSDEPADAGRCDCCKACPGHGNGSHTTEHKLEARPAQPRFQWAQPSQNQKTAASPAKKSGTNKNAKQRPSAWPKEYQYKMAWPKANQFKVERPTIVQPSLPPVKFESPMKLPEFKWKPFVQPQWVQPQFVQPAWPQPNFVQPKFDVKPFQAPIHIEWPEWKWQQSSPRENGTAPKVVRKQTRSVIV